MRPSAPAGISTRSSPRTGWWHARSKATGRRRCARSSAAEAELAAQRARRASPLTSQELEQLQRAGADLRAIFHAPSTSQRDRKLLVRALICEIVVTVDREAGTVEVRITWEGGAETRLAPLKLPRRGQARSTPRPAIYQAPSRAAAQDARHPRPPPDPAAAGTDGELVGVRQAAAELDVTSATVYRWLRDGYITGEQPTAGAPGRFA